VLMVVAIFGGLLGGLAYGALTHGQGSVSPGASTRGGKTSGPSPVRWMLGLLFMIGGGLFLMVAGVQTFEIVKIVRREPKAVTAAELCREDFVEAAPGWL